MLETEMCCFGCDVHTVHTGQDEITEHINEDDDHDPENDELIVKASYKYCLLKCFNCDQQPEFNSSSELLVHLKQYHSNKTFRIKVQYSLDLSTIMHENHVYCDKECISQPESLVSNMDMASYPYHFWPLVYGWKRTLFPEIRYTTPCGRTFRDSWIIQKYLNSTESLLEIDQFTFDNIEIDVESYTATIASLENRTYLEDIVEVDHYIDTLPITTYQPQTEDNLDELIYIEDYTFLDNNKYICPLEIIEIKGCNCLGDCANNSCPCVNRTLSSSNGSSRGYDYGRLNVQVPTGIYECSDECKCSRHCLNNFTDNEISVNLEIFETENCGLGVRAMTDIPKGAFISCYFGDIRDFTESLRPGNEKVLDGGYRNGYYLPLPVKIGNRFFPNTVIVDSYSKGNIGRFFNHSCNPNMFIQHVYKDNLRFPFIALFTYDVIKAGTELTFDYGVRISQYRSFHCKCGEANCRVAI